MRTYRGVPLTPARRLRLSNHGLAFLVIEEGIELRPYVDSEGWATAGIGHLIQPMHKGVTAQDRARFTFRDRAAAFAYFREVDEPKYEAAIHNALGNALLTRAMYDMVFSGVFNCGPGFVQGTVGRMIRQGNYRAAANAFHLWETPRVLAPRRQRESSRFLRGKW